MFCVHLNLNNLTNNFKTKTIMITTVSKNSKPTIAFTLVAGIFLFLLMSINGYSQIKFSEGYFIENNGTKTTCLIKNIDWNRNPTEFEYKLTINANSKLMTINDVKEFGINEEVKFIRFKGPVDKVGNRSNTPALDGRPVFQEERLFLKVLVEGEASLYTFRDQNLYLYFLKKNEGDIEQLVHKYYNDPTQYSHMIRNIRQNNQYKQQLSNSLKCADIDQNDFERVKHTQKSLVEIVVGYNKCMNAEITWQEPSQKISLHLSIKPGLRSSSFKINNQNLFVNETKFDSKSSFTLGIEAELILPFNKGKWAFVAEPTYQSFKSNAVANSSIAIIENAGFDVDYSSIELPLGIRHYLFLNEQSKFFINVFYVLDLSFSDENIVYTFKPRFVDPREEVLDSQTRSNLAAGFGYKYQNYSVELRYGFKKDLLPDFNTWSSDYQTFSFILGYTLF